MKKRIAAALCVAMISGSLTSCAEIKIDELKKLRMWDGTAPDQWKAEGGWMPEENTEEAYGSDDAEERAESGGENAAASDNAGSETKKLPEPRDLPYKSDFIENAEEKTEEKAEEKTEEKTQVATDGNAEAAPGVPVATDGNAEAAAGFTI